MLAIEVRIKLFSWALPVSVVVHKERIYIQILCFDIEFRVVRRILW